MTDRDALIILNMISGVGPKKVRDLVSILGSPEKILTSSHNDLLSIPGIGPKLATTISTWQKSINIDKELSLAGKAGVKIITSHKNGGHRNSLRKYCP